MVYTILLTWYKLGQVWTIWRIKIIQHNRELLGRMSQEKSSVLCTQLWRSNRRYDKSKTYKWDGKRGRHLICKKMLCYQLLTLIINYMKTEIKKPEWLSCFTFGWWSFTKVSIWFTILWSRAFTFPTLD